MDHPVVAVRVVGSDASLIHLKQVHGAPGDAVGEGWARQQLVELPGRRATRQGSRKNVALGDASIRELFESRRGLLAQVESQRGVDRVAAEADAQTSAMELVVPAVDRSPDRPDHGRGDAPGDGDVSVQRRQNPEALTARVRGSPCASARTTGPRGRAVLGRRGPASWA